jgi:hypothetical protein
LPRVPNPLSWLRQRLGRHDAPETILPEAGDRPLHDLPRESLRAAFSLALGPGMSNRLAVLGQRRVPAVDRLERLLLDTSPSGRRFGAMLRELSSRIS